MRLLYGATPLEDIINYNVVVRALTEWTSTNQNDNINQTSIAEGIGGVVVGNDNSATVAAQGLVNVRQTYIQGVDNSAAGTAAAFAGIGAGLVPNNFAASGVTSGSTGDSITTTRRYQVNLALGLFTQDKLIPAKFMASQLAIELTLENAVSCIFVATAGTSSGTTPTYTVTGVNLIPEILEFDASYDAMFLKGLREGGIPIKFSSWHTFIFTTGGAANVNLLVQERSRSVKSLFCVQRKSPSTITTDSHALFFDTGSTGGSSLQNYQWRIGGRYFPAAPVQCSMSPGSGVTNGGAEAFIELQKALNTVGDYRLSSSVCALNWAISNTSAGLPEYDYVKSIRNWGPTGLPTYITVTSTTNSFSGNQPSGAFTMSVSLETSNGVEISGLNAEEQSDIAFIANWSSAQSSAYLLEVYSYYDAMIILRENNVLELIQ